MKNPILIILGTFVLTIIATIAYCIYQFKTLPDNVTIGIPFGFVVIVGLALFSETIVFAIIFHNYLRVIWMILLPTFLLTSVIPIYWGYQWFSDRPVKIPEAGQLPVSFENYNTDSKLIIDDYLQTEIDNNRVDVYMDTIEKAYIDTIIYSLDMTKFFAIIVAVNGNKLYCANYRVGRLVSGKWELGKPKGNIWSTCFQSVDDFKNKLRQYYDKSYSINKSSDKPDIWTDEYIFNF